MKKLFGLLMIIIIFGRDFEICEFHLSFFSSCILIFNGIRDLKIFFL